MAAPNVDPRFATDATYAVDGDAWGGDPTKLDPGSGRQAEGFEADSLPAEWLNWILNRLGAWVYFFTTLLGGLDGTAEWAYQAAKTRARYVTPRVDATNGTWVAHQGSIVHTGTSSEKAWHYLDTELRTGDVLQYVHLWCDPKTTAITSFRVFKIASAGAGGLTVTYLGALQSTDGTNAIQALNQNSLNETIDRQTYTYGLEFTSATNTAELWGVVVSAQDPGPRGPG